MSTFSIDVVQKESIASRSPDILVGLPDAGLVGTIAATFLVDSLQMKEVGYIDSARFQPLIIVRDNEVKNPIRIYGKDDLVVVISDIPVLPLMAVQFSKSLLGWAKKLNPNLVINITGLPVQNRLQIEKPEVLCLATGKQVMQLVRDANLTLFSDGVLFGTYAAVIKECVVQQVPSLTLLAQSHLNFPDPTASIEALSIINSLLKMNVDLAKLHKEAEMIRIKTRELMKQTESALRESRMEGGGPAIYR
ncbi:MAG: proteasome assembly chaperone family protein [Nitrososphaerales archaeon]